MPGLPLSSQSRETGYIAQCSALMLPRENILGDYTLSLDTLKINWLLLLKFATNSSDTFLH